MRIEGVDSLTGAEHRIIPDRIETGTFIIAAAITNGELELKHCNLDHLIAVTDRLEEVGVKITRENGTIYASSSCRLQAVDMTTQPYPGFPTDLQAQLMAPSSASPTATSATERIFPDRFLHVGELNRMGAPHPKRRRHGNRPRRQEPGATVMASDLLAPCRRPDPRRHGRQRHHPDRPHLPRRSGLRKIEQKLAAVGADIQRVKEK